MLGTKALTPRIVERVCGSNPTVQKNPLIQRRLISLAVIANNTYHLWLTTFFDGAMIIPPENLAHVPPGIRDILTIVGDAASAIYVREPLHAGQDRIDILLGNLRSSTTDPPSLTFEDIIVSWYKDLLLDDSNATYKTGMNNQPHKYQKLIYKI